MLVALITGVLPALKVTRGLQQRLRQVTAGGGGLRFGAGAWTAVIVAQVAVTVAFPVTVFFAPSRCCAGAVRQRRIPGAGSSAARLEMSPESITRFPAASAELERRLVAEPAVAGVTFASLLPRMDHPQRRIEVDGEDMAASSARERSVSSVSIDLNYFDTLGAPLLMGRAFNSGDL